MGDKWSQVAERLGEWWLVEIKKAVVLARSVSTKYQRVDLFGLDLLGKTKNGRWVGCQVTTGGYEATRQRKRKLEKIPWFVTDRIYLLKVKKERVGRGVVYVLEAQKLDPLTGEWSHGRVVRVPRQEFLKWRRTRHGKEN